jgi:hypothetical protein
MSDTTDHVVDSDIMFNNHIQFRVPEYIPDDPEYWLAQLEVQFKIARIANQTAKFTYLAASLPRAVAPDLRDLVINPPADNPYDALRAALIKRTAVSEETRLRQLMSGLQLGDKSPSQLLRQMRQLGETHKIDDSLMRHFWMQRLPASVQGIISPFIDNSTLDELAASADKVVEHIPASLHTIGASPSSSTSENKAYAEILQELQSLRLEVQHIKADRNQSSSRQGRRQPDRKRSFSRKRSQSRGDNGLCWFHDTFRKDARNCRPPCTWSTQGNTNAGQ